MSRTIIDQHRAEASLDHGQSTTIDLDAVFAAKAFILVDDGTTDGKPAEYTVKLRVYDETFDDYMLVVEQDATRSRSWTDIDIVESKIQLELTNNSEKAGQTYRIRAATHAGEE